MAHSGFTIVELLVVIVVIGILAAITLVSYTGISTKARTVTAQSDLNNFANNVELSKISSNNGQYPQTLTSAMNFKVSKSAYATNRNNWYYAASTDGSKYALGVVTVDGTGFFLTSNGGIQPSSVVDAANTGALVGLSNATTDGYDFSGSTGWLSWTN